MSPSTFRYAEGGSWLGLVGVFSGGLGAVSLAIDW
jgi:hypothetical protein